MAVATLAGCNGKTDTANADETKKSLDQLVQVERETLATARDHAAATKSAGQDLKVLIGRVEALEKAVAASSASRKRGAIYLPLETDTVCDNDTACINTARAVCSKINYPNATPSRLTPGTRPLLNSVICFD